MAKERPDTRAEWSKKNQYNSFNSYKGLAYYSTHYIPIANWFLGKTNFLPPPIECSLDPSHKCNYKCGHCNAQRYLVLKPEQVKEDEKFMSRKHLVDIVNFLADWGVKAVCIGGGGEPLMNKDVWGLPTHIKQKGMESSFATNGSLIDDKIADEMMNCKWVGVSVDAGDKETFYKVHQANCFEKVIDNLEMLVQKKEETKSNVDISYKFLIRPDNWHSLIDACKLAKEIGVRDFHARPADLERKDFESGMKRVDEHDVDTIADYLQVCRSFETDNFRVFGVMHKYDADLRVVHRFKKCVPSSLMIQCCADGNVYVCADHRIEKRFRLGKHSPNPRNILAFWGSDRHRRLLKSIDVNKECSRCTYGEYASQIEKVVMEDGMCLNFP